MNAVIKAIDYYLPETILDNRQLEELFPETSARKIMKGTGIAQRHVVREEQCASDLAVEAAKKIFDSHCITPQEIDFILFCTQCPDFFLPATACVIQERLGIPTSVGALDFNLGCSGFVFGLSLAKGLIETQQANHVLLLTADTLTRHIRPDDRALKVLFGDAAAATVISHTDSVGTLIGPFVFGTDGKGADNLIIKSGAMRHRFPQEENDRWLHMDGAEIFNFTIERIPGCIMELLGHAEMQVENIDYWIFHQANAFLLEHLRSLLDIPEQKFCIDLEENGNTASVSIPLALKRAYTSHRVRNGDTVAMVGFGVGYSWAATICQIQL